MNELHQVMSSVTLWFSKLYVYCTDFLINLANMSNTSYYEANFFFFCVLYPFLLLGLPLLALYLKSKLKKLRVAELDKTAVAKM